MKVKRIGFRELLDWRKPVDVATSASVSLAYVYAMIDGSKAGNVSPWIQKSLADALECTSAEVAAALRVSAERFRKSKKKRSR